MYSYINYTGKISRKSFTGRRANGVVARSDPIHGADREEARG